MNLSETLHKNSPAWSNRSATLSDYEKLVERNTELVDELKDKNKEIGRLKFIINEFNECYIKVMTKCDEMIKNRRYMSDIAIQMYATDIKDICHYYADKAIRIEIKGSISNER